MNSPEAAAAEKIAAGEKGNVERYVRATDVVLLLLSRVARGDDRFRVAFREAVCADAKA